jgi:hypothetical protein
MTLIRSLGTTSVALRASCAASGVGSELPLQALKSLNRRVGVVGLSHLPPRRLLVPEAAAHRSSGRLRGGPMWSVADIESRHSAKSLLASLL